VSHTPTQDAAAQALAIGVLAERPGPAREVLDGVGRDGWLDTVDHLLRGRHINASAGERALDVREDVLDDRDATVLDVDDWVSAIADAAAEQLWSEREVEAVTRGALKVFNIERELREVGLLAADRRVWTHMAHDLSSAVYLVRAGLRSGVAERRFTAEVLAAARANAAVIFTDWRDFALSYASAQSCLFGGYPCDDVWDDAVAVVKELLDDPHSPWAGLAFPRPEQDA